MKITKDKVVVVSYELSVEGKIVDKATAEDPMDYIQGENMLLPRIEAELEGKEAGDCFECIVPPEEGYGEYDLKMVIDLPKESFMYNGQLREDLLQEGKYIPMLNSAGQVCHGLVVSIAEDKVTMDFNPPMAGKTMNFKGQVISVRDATEKELTEGLHGEFLPQQGGCHCGGGCNGGCGGGCGSCGSEGGDSEGCNCGEGGCGCGNN